MEKQKKEGTHHQQMIQKTLEGGLEFMPELEQLEMLLSPVITDEEELEAVASALLRIFGTIYAVVTAVPAELLRVRGMKMKTAVFLHSLPDYLGIVQRSQMAMGKAPLFLEDREKIGNYVQTLFNHKQVEAFYMISLKGSGQLIRFDKISEGTLDETAVYLRRIARQAILNEAGQVILAHNHPGGKLIPSIEDLKNTRAIMAGLRVLDITVVDHIIVSGCEWVSLKEMGVLTSPI